MISRIDRHPDVKPAGATMRVRHRRRDERGFTLFEMVIAVSIFALMGVAAYGTLAELTRSGQVVTDGNDRLSDLQFAVNYFVRDWTQVSPRQIRDQYGDPKPAVVLNEEALQFTRSGWEDLLRGSREVPRSSLQRVEYRLDEDRLMRLHWRNLDQQVGAEPLQSVLLDGVESMEIEFYDADGNEILTWPPSNAGLGSSNAGEPVILSLRLELTDLGDIVRLLEINNGVL